MKRKILGFILLIILTANVSIVFAENNAIEDSTDAQYLLQLLEADKISQTYLSGYMEDDQLYKDAMKIYENLISVKPDCISEVYNNYGQLEYARSNFGKAIDLFDKSLKADSENVLAYVNVGFMLYKIGRDQDLQKALEIGKTALDLALKAPKYIQQEYLIPLYRMIGIIHSQIGHNYGTKSDYYNANDNLDIAESYLNKSIELVRNQREKSEARLGIANVELRRSKLQTDPNKKQAFIENAIKIAKEIQNNDPDYYYSYYFLGHLYMNDSKSSESYDLAIENYTKALDIKKDAMEVHYNLGCIYAIKNNVEKAVEKLKDAFNYGFRDIELIDSLDRKNDRFDPMLLEIKYTKELQLFVKEMKKKYRL